MLFSEHQFIFGSLLNSTKALLSCQSTDDLCKVVSDSMNHMGFSGAISFWADKYPVQKFFGKRLPKDLHQFIEDSFQSSIKLQRSDNHLAFKSNSREVVLIIHGGFDKVSSDILMDPLTQYFDAVVSHYESLKNLSDIYDQLGLASSHLGQQEEQLGEVVTSFRLLLRQTYSELVSEFTTSFQAIALEDDQEEHIFEKMSELHIRAEKAVREIATRVHEQQSECKIVTGLIEQLTSRSKVGVAHSSDIEFF